LSNFSPNALNFSATTLVWGVYYYNMADAGLYVIEVDGPLLAKSYKFFSVYWNYIKSKTKERQVCE